MTQNTMREFHGPPGAWNTTIAGMPGRHLLQTWEWAHVKEAYGWQAIPLIWDRTPSGDGTESPPDAGGSSPAASVMLLKKQIVSRGLAARLSIMYAPKGPLLDWSDASLRARVLDDLEKLAKRSHAIFLKLDPDVIVGRGLPGAGGAREDAGGIAIESELRQRGWRYSPDQVQFRNTVLLDLTGSDQAILARMKPKTRYNIRLAQKKGVAVRQGSLEELPALYKMYAETSARDGFVIRDANYYNGVWKAFVQLQVGRDQPCAEILVADVAGTAVAAIFVFYFADRAYYIYGMSREAHREKMPNHLLQWEAIQRAKARGCTCYDLWGAPDALVESDSMWGVFRFKEGLGGELVRTIGAWDYPASTIWYSAYTRLVPRLLGIMRARGRHKTRQDLAAT